MINKSIQPGDLANKLSSTPQTTSNRSTEGGDGASFSILLSGHETDLPGKGTGKPSSTTGNNLPEDALQSESQDPAMPGAGLPNASENPDTIDAQFLTTTLELPGQPVEPVPGKQVQALPSVEQVTEQAVRTSIPAGGELIPTPVQLDGQQDPFSARVVEKPLQPQAVQQQVQSLSQAVGQQARPADPVAGTHIISQTVPVETPLVAADLLQNNLVTDSGQVQGRTAVNRFPAVETGRVSPNQEPIASIMREAAQLAVASQTGNGDLKQSLQGHRGSQQGSDITAALTRTETNPLAFLQTLSESSPLTLPSARVQVPVGQQGWGNAVGQQVTWFISQNVSAANLRLNPQHLGPVEMQISMEGDKANISFLSQHTAVREALESSLPRLREMLSESGLNLANVNISQHGASDQNARNRAELQQGVDFSRMGSDTNEAEAGENIQHHPATMIGLIDDYA